MAASSDLQKLIEPATGGALGLNLRHLRALSAVAATGSVAGAAETLCRVPSAVTRSIAELEAALGRSLFQRHARGMVPNRYGERVQLRARRIEHEFERARQQLVARGCVGASANVQVLFASILNGRRLAVFASLSEKRNMPTVAREFGITQPGVSTALNDLEDGLGVRLLDRTARGLLPTAAGEIVAFHFKRVLAELRHVLPDLAALDGALQGSIQIGALPLGRTLIVPRAVARLLQRHPQLHVATVESPYDVLAAGLRSGDIDFMFGALRPEIEGDELQQEALFEDRLSVIARAGHPLAGAGRLDVAALRRSTWVLSRRGSPSRELLERSFAGTAEPLPAPAVETGDLAVLRCLLLESDMLTALSAHQLRYEIRDGSLVALDFPLDGTRRQIGIIQRRGSQPPPGTLALLDELRAVVRGTEDALVGAVAAR